MWKHFEIYALASLILWVLSALLCFSKNKTAALIRDISMVAGSLSIFVFIAQLWNYMERPPLRTLGETRLWYSAFISAIGFIVYKRWNYRLFLLFSIMMSVVFLLINYLKPEIHSKTLMPALQSIWFVPHVIVYIISYSFLGFSCLIGILGYAYSKGKIRATNIHFMPLADNITYIGYGFLTLGLVFGALWAKEAWGHYWTWDPKETWAFITWGVYLAYIHVRYHSHKKDDFNYAYLALAFVVLLICWFGINYLPAAQNSVHVYSN